MNILFAGQVGESLPPLYAGVPKRALLLAKIWRDTGARVGICFTYRHNHEDDLGAQAEYFFEYNARPNALAKIRFILSAAVFHPIYYIRFVSAGANAFSGLTTEILQYAAYGVFLTKIVATFKPDVLVAESGLTRAFFAAIVAKQHNIPFVLETYAEVHDKSVMNFKNEEARTHYWKTLFSLCERIIAPSDYCAKGPLTYASSELVHMVFATTLDSAVFENDTRTQQEGRTRFSLPTNEFIVAAVGSFSPRKGHDHLIKAVAEGRKKGSDMGVLLCGEGNPEWLRELARQEGIEDHVYIFQNLSEEELRLLFKAADMYCDASNTPRACLGIALTEALATGMPAIAYDVAGLPEVVADKKTGYLVPVDDIPALAATIEMLYRATPEERALLGANGRIRAKTVFDIHIIAAQLMSELKVAYDAHTSAKK
jgi:glycosyltransferase involved in cell wall biosynthesis